MKLVVVISDDEYRMLKAYAAAKRKYEVDKGFPVDKAIAEMVSIGLEAISETIILDKNGIPVEWNTCDKNGCFDYEKLKIYKKY